MNVLLLGGPGQLGQELRWLAPAGARVVAPERAALDLAAAGQIEEAVAAEAWTVVINAAAYTAVDRAEAERAAAFAVNADAPERLAIATARHAIPLLHVSTDYVFDGRKGAPYHPADPVNPLGVYGASKAAGEQAVRAGNRRHVILRTAWVYSPFGHNFLRTMLRLAGERENLRVVNDQCGSPTAASDLAAACLAIASRLSTDDGTASGTFHYTNAGETTWYGFAAAICALAGQELARVPKLVPISTAEYPTPARRPSDSRLDCSATVARFSVTQPEWRLALAATLERLPGSRICTDPRSGVPRRRATPARRREVEFQPPR